MKRKTMGWLIVFLLFIVYMLNYMDRSALSITAPLIEKELGFNAAEMGMIFSAFFIGYALFNFIGGWASDKVGPKTVFLIAALLWSVFCGLTGLVTGLWTMRRFPARRRGVRADSGPAGVILRLAPRIWHYFLIWPGLGTALVLYR